MTFKVVIPARYTSKRLPGKVLLKVKGKSIIQYVYENSCRSGAEQVIIATDDERIAECAQTFNAEFCFTSNKHKSGTDRISEITKIYSWTNSTIIVNVQADEPMMLPDSIQQVAVNLHAHPNTGISTLCTHLPDDKEYKNQNVVKVIRDENNTALTFSRNVEAIEYYRRRSYEPYRHLGIYAYNVRFLSMFTQLPQTELEKQERLEQLRALEHGEKIYVDMCKYPVGVGVDTQEDYEALLQIMRSK